MKNIALFTLVLSLLVQAIPALAQDYMVPENAPAHIRRAVESESRDESQRARDAGRKPTEVMALAGLSEGDHVAEISTFGQYYTPMLVEAVGPTGMVEMYDLPLLAGFSEGAVGEAGQAFADAHTNAQYAIVDYNTMEFSAGLDAVYNVLSYHDFDNFGVDQTAFNAKVFNSLTPGGKYVVIDHLAEEGSGWRDAATLHRIGKKAIVDEVTAAGFTVLVDSDILENAEDDRTAVVFQVRGQTSRAVLVFQKPM